MMVMCVNMSPEKAYCCNEGFIKRFHTSSYHQFFYFCKVAKEFHKNGPVSRHQILGKGPGGPICLPRNNILGFLCYSSQFYLEMTRDVNEAC